MVEVAATGPMLQSERSTFWWFLLTAALEVNFEPVDWWMRKWWFGTAGLGSCGCWWSIRVALNLHAYCVGKAPELEHNAWEE